MASTLSCFSVLYGLGSAFLGEPSKGMELPNYALRALLGTVHTISADSSSTPHLNMSGLL